jgi:hypothetical protein
MPEVPTWSTRARRHAEKARELDEIASSLAESDFVFWERAFSRRPCRGPGVIARLRALAEAERQERDRLMQLQERADA